MREVSPRAVKRLVTETYIYMKKIIFTCFAMLALVAGIVWICFKKN
jgi:hypothetical protein